MQNSCHDFCVVELVMFIATGVSVEIQRRLLRGEFSNGFYFYDF
jgi:hypothetical protein